MFIRKFVKIFKLNNMTNIDLTEPKKANGLTLEMINSFYTGGGHSIHNTIEYAQGFSID